MKPATEHKAAAIGAELKRWPPGDVLHRLPLLLALLTSADAGEREDGKKTVRSLMQLGGLALLQERDALALIERGERCDDRP